jgi:hypothetical protein
VRQQLAEDAALAHTPGDELRVLAAEVEDEDLVGTGRARARRGIARGDKRLGHQVVALVAACARGRVRPSWTRTQGEGDPGGIAEPEDDGPATA